MVSLVSLPAATAASKTAKLTRTSWLRHVSISFSDTKSLVSYTYTRHVCWHSPSPLPQKHHSQPIACQQPAAPGESCGVYARASEDSYVRTCTHVPLLAQVHSTLPGDDALVLEPQLSSNRNQASHLMDQAGRGMTIRELLSHTRQQRFATVWNQSQSLCRMLS